jgi:hypothetical protein
MDTFKEQSAATSITRLLLVQQPKVDNLQISYANPQICDIDDFVRFAKLLNVALVFCGTNLFVICLAYL